MLNPLIVDTLTTEELLQLQQRYEAMLRRRERMIHNVCLKYSSGDESRFLELVQEVQIGLWLHLDKYRGGKAEGAWVYWHSRKIISDYFHHRLAPPEQLREEIADTLAEEVYHGREQLEEIMVYLTPEERSLLEMRLEEDNVAGMAARLHCTPNAVYKRLRRVIQKAKIINEKLNRK